MPYYVLNAQEYDGHHEVHDTNHTDKCTYPTQPNIVNLGFQPNCNSAIAQAKQLKPGWKIDGCYWCISECHAR